MWKYIKKAINSDFLNEPLDTKIDAVKTKVDTVDTVVDTVNTNVGSDADSASASGSVHAKVKDLANKVIDAGLSVAHLNNTPAQNTWYTVLDDTTGGGVLHTIGVFSQDNFFDVEVRVTIDGTAITLENEEIYVFLKTDSDNTLSFNVNAYYNTSLKVEYLTRASNGLETYCTVLYTPR